MAKLTQVVIDRAEPDRLVDPAGTGPRFWFRAVPEAKVVKNRVHLDLSVTGGRAEPLAERRRKIDADGERLVAAGTTVFRVLEAGDEFCVT